MMIYTIYLTFLFIVALVMSGLGVFAWMYRGTLTVKMYAVLMFVAAIWSWAAVFSATSSDIATAEFFGEYMRHSAIAFTTVFFLIFCLSFTGRTHWLEPRRLALLFIVPSISLILIWTRTSHHLFTFDSQYEVLGSIILRTAYSRGVWFWVNSAYIYGLAMLGIVMLFRHMLRSSYPYRQQARLLLIGVLLAVFTNIPTTFGLTPLGMSLVPIGGAAMCIVFAWALFGYRLLEIIPIAHDVIFANMDDSAIVMNLSNRIIDINPAAARAFRWNRNDVIGQPLIDLLDETQHDLIERHAQATEAEAQEEITVGRHIYDMRISPIFNHRHLLVGRLIVLRDITERVHLTNEVRASEERLRQLGEHSKDIIWIWSPKRMVEYISPAYEHYTGTTPEDLYENAFLVVEKVHPDDRVAFGEALEAVMKGSFRKMDLRVRHTDGTVYYLEGWGSPIFDDEGNVLRCVGIWRDISDHVALVNDLNAYAHTVAHDLKTPLTAVLGYAQLLEGDLIETIEAEQLGFLQVISSTAERMERIIDELLLMASVRDMSSVPVEELDTAAIVTQVQARFRQQIEEKQAEIILPQAWPTALGYGSWVEEVWANYVSNALKYGGTPPCIELGATRNPDNAKVRFFVKDNGPGLSAQAQAEVFVHLSRLDTARAEGHGIGLSIVQRIIEKLGGEVGIESEIGAGSSFYFELPTSK